LSLTLDDVQRIITEAEKESFRDMVLLKLMAGYGLSVGEIVGTAARRWNKQTEKWVAAEPNLKGLQNQDLSQDGVLVRRKMGGPTELIPLKQDHIGEVRKLIGRRKKGKIIPLSVSRVEQLLRRYSARAGVFDGKVRPQMFRDYYRKNQGLPYLSTTIPLTTTNPPTTTVSRTEGGRHVGRKIDYPGLTYAPINEGGVILLFATMNSNDELGFSVESIADAFPDALVVDYRANRERGVKKYIEFEFLSSNFAKHNHDPAKCDIIVCWEHDWNDCPPNLEVIALKTLIKELERETFGTSR